MYFVTLDFIKVNVQEKLPVIHGLREIIQCFMTCVHGSSFLVDILIMHAS